MVSKQMLKDELSVFGSFKIIMGAVGISVFMSALVGSMYFASAMQQANLSGGF